MSTGSGEGAAWREQLSALADGELADPAPLCDAWRHDAQVRATWHCYQLIGDVLRSDDLAASPARDAAFLLRIRERLAAEPVVLAPEPLPDAARERRFDGAAERRFGWRAAGAVAAGFVAVAGVYSVMRPPVDTPAGFAGAAAPAMLARIDSAPGFLSASQVAPFFGAAEPSVHAALPDPRLNAYVVAHKQFAGSSTMAIPNVYLRPSPEAATAGR